MRYFTEGCFFSDNHFVDETKLFQVSKGNRAWPLHQGAAENKKCIRKG